MKKKEQKEEKQQEPAAVRAMAPEGRVLARRAARRLRGLRALHAALASCAPGLVAVNIDNGYGAASAAIRALRVLPERS